MKILIAVDSFKGTLSSKEVASTIKNNLNEQNVEFDIIPIADGGEGTVDSLRDATNGNTQWVSVQNAFGDYEESHYCLAHNNETAIVEVALSSGIGLIETGKLNPYKTTSYGLGETIRDALDHQIKKLVIGIGGSSTNDGGSGMLQALGVKFFDKDDNEIEVMNGMSIGQVMRIDTSGLDPRIINTYVEVACDVTNPLLGPTGCSEIFSRQKGATDDMVKVLEQNMSHYAKVVAETIEKDLSKTPGVGAAGGLGFGLLTFLEADLLSGLEVVADATKLEERIAQADVVFTGEGSFDHQSLMGKAPTRIASLAKKFGKKVYGVFGLSSIEEMPELFDAIYQVVPTVCEKDDSLGNPQDCLAKLIKKIEL